MELEEFRDIVSQYCFRRLTNDSDIPDAFAGVIRGFEPTLGKLRFGLPTGFLGLMLLWEANGNPPKSRRTGVDIPSWYWAAWKGCNFSLDSRGGLIQNASGPLIFFHPSEEGKCTALSSFDIINGAEDHMRLHKMIKELCRVTVAPSLNRNSRDDSGQSTSAINLYP
jgi:hypothetical protein